MRVHVHPADMGGTGFYRLREPARVLSAAGYDVSEPQRSWTCAWDRNPDDPRAHVVDITPPGADVVVAQRPLRRVMCEALAALQRRGIAVVVDTDDLFSAIHPDNPAFNGAHPSDPDHSWRWLAEACRIADLVTVSTPALAEHYGRHGRCVVLPNCVPAWYLDVHPDPNRELVIGYVGSPETHPGDLEEVGPAVAQVLRERPGVRFTAIGGARTCAILGVDGETQPWVPLANYPAAVASLDIGLAPLKSTAFSRAKSDLKMSEYAALGVACVASPLPEYARLHALGVGLLADRPREWRKHLRALLNDDYRFEIASRGRAVMATRTYELNGEKWWHSWELALQNSRKRAA